MLLTYQEATSASDSRPSSFLSSRHRWKAASIFTQVPCLIITLLFNPLFLRYYPSPFFICHLSLSIVNLLISYSVTNVISVPNKSVQPRRSIEKHILVCHITRVSPLCRNDPGLKGRNFLILKPGKCGWRGPVGCCTYLCNGHTARPRQGRSDAFSRVGSYSHGALLVQRIVR